ncbi:MAG: SpoIIE family protein phosphatase [Saprospiraceae bacterium]|nr:SpoIIE family protein phosphatase [Saprospiraceae bacterium]
MTIKILSVDDEKHMESLIRQMFRKQIRQKKFEFFFAQNGIQALELLKKHEDISLILSDINMPGMDGLTLLSKLIDLNNPLLTAIMISAYGDMDNIRSAMNKGAFDFITKPINFKDLELTLDKTVMHIQQLKESQEKEMKLSALEYDLDIAKDIQRAMLPKKFPPFLGSERFDLHALLKPAKVVGGDLFDFFLMGKDHLFILLGDVSDKGIPAALFMAVTKTVFKTHFYNTYISGLKEEVNRVNKILCEGNDSFMFVTVFVAILNLRTGELEYVDAGHEPILHLKTKGGIDQLPKQGCMAIGIDPDHEYISHKVHLNPGDGLFLYSDGVPDAADIDNQRYTLDGTIEFIKSFWKDATAKELNDKLMENLDQFIGEAKQFDDITMLSLKYNPEGDL